MTMYKSATLIRKGNALNPELTAALEGSDADAFYAVRVEKMTPEDVAFFLETKTKVGEGMAALERGDVVDSDAFFAEIEAEYGKK